MKQFILLLASTILLFSCNLENRKPEFKRIENINVTNLSASVTEVTADVVVYNPNGVSVYLNSTEIDVFANETKISHISQTNKTEISKKSEFKIPIKAKLNLMDLVQNQGSMLDIINSGLKAFKDKKIDLDFNGTAEFEVAKLKFDVPIEHQETVKLDK